MKIRNCIIIMKEIKPKYIKHYLFFTLDPNCMTIGNGCFLAEPSCNRYGNLF